MKKLGSKRTALREDKGWTMYGFNDGVSDIFVAEGPDENGEMIQISGYTWKWQAACAYNRFGVNLFPNGIVTISPRKEPKCPPRQ